MRFYSELNNYEQSMAIDFWQISEFFLNLDEIWFHVKKIGK